MTGSLEDQVLIFLRHTTHHPDDLMGSLLFTFFNLAEPGINFVLGQFSYATSVVQDGIRFTNIVGEFVALFPQRSDHQFTV